MVVWILKVWFLLNAYCFHHEVEKLLQAEDYLCMCNQVQDMLFHNQRLVLDLTKETNGRNTDMNWAVRI